MMRQFFFLYPSCVQLLKKKAGLLPKVKAIDRPFIINKRPLIYENFKKWLLLFFSVKH